MDTPYIKMQRRTFFPFSFVSASLLFSVRGIIIQVPQNKWKQYVVGINKKREGKRGKGEKNVKAILSFSDEKKLPLQRCDSLEKRLLIFVN